MSELAPYIFAALLVACLLGLASTIDTTNKRLEAIDRALWAIRDAIREQKQ
jgi:type II secretory pathway pseudopilin PulG